MKKSSMSIPFDLMKLNIGKLALVGVLGSNPGGYSNVLYIFGNLPSPFIWITKVRIIALCSVSVNSCFK